MLPLRTLASPPLAPQAASDAPTPAYSADFIRRRLVVFVGIVIG
jgi:hypothetical protein